MPVYSYILIVITSFIFFLLIWFLKNDSRRLIVGTLSNALICILAIDILTVGASVPNVAGIVSVMILMAIVMILLLAITILPGMITNNLLVYKRESHNLANSLMFLLALAFIIYAFAYQPAVVKAPKLIQSILTIVPISIAYLFVAFANFLTASMLYYFKPIKYDQDVLIVLGSGLINGDKVGRLLANRILAAIKFSDKQLHLTGRRPLIIFSGGQGNNESLSEGLAMQKWAQNNGYDTSETLIESQSRNTYQNLLFSSQLMPNQVQHVLIVSNSYHIFRAVMLARYFGFEYQGLGGKTPLYFIPNALVREFVAVLVMNRKRHAITLGTINLFVIIFLILY